MKKELKLIIFDKLLRKSKKCERYWYRCGSCTACIIDRAIKSASEESRDIKEEPAG